MESAEEQCVGADGATSGGSDWSFFVVPVVLVVMSLGESQSINRSEEQGGLELGRVLDDIVPELAHSVCGRQEGLCVDLEEDELEKLDGCQSVVHGVVEDCMYKSSKRGRET